MTRILIILNRSFNQKSLNIYHC